MTDHATTDADEYEDAEARLLAKLDGYWQCLVDPEDAALADRLVAAGQLERLRQVRRGFPAMYRLPAASTAAAQAARERTAGRAP
ncbi:MAG: hypothetical protein WD341_01790 [Tistlia sp.]|uniref:hypothetical protein n=1 Tax=Tistlia sp. TaxID=3057121 RepID=UPI0034A237CA